MQKEKKKKICRQMDKGFDPQTKDESPFLLSLFVCLFCFLLFFVMFVWLFMCVRMLRGVGGGGGGGVEVSSVGLLLSRTSLLYLELWALIHGNPILACVVCWFA